MKNPIANVKEKFGDKAKLVSELEKFTKDGDLWVSRLNENKGLAHVSNTKLLRLHKTFTEVKAKFGTRAKLIDAICDLEKRVKDEGFKKRLGEFPVPRLWDMYTSAVKRTGAKAKKESAKPKAAKTAATKKPAAKKSTKTAAAKKA